MREECVGGVWVPAAIATHFRKEQLVPFSYTKPNVKFLLTRAKEKLPKAIAFKFGLRKPQTAILECRKFEKFLAEAKASLVSPLVKKEKENMAQPVHLQYNSPMPIYSRETAEEQYQQQIGGDGKTTPIPMPAGDKHFDPSKSATLKFIKEGDEGHFGEHFFEQIASAEAPKQIPQQEPDWARYAREKSERARSRTPADPSQRHSAAATPTYYYERTRPQSYHERPRDVTPHEFVEKTRTYTHTEQPRWGPAYSQTLPHRRRVRSETREQTPGYEYGGLDYTKGLHFPAPSPYDYTYERRSRSDDKQRRFKPGYELGGTDFGVGYVSSGPYHGHGPDPPRLRPRYSADPRSACNSYYAPNIDEVDANLLVGDTISNQKIRHEVRNINQNEFGTSFAPPGGFKRDHMTVHRSPAPPEPVTFSLSANKNRYRYASTGSLPTRERDTYRQPPPQEQYVYRQPPPQHDVYRQPPPQEYDQKEVNIQTLLNDDVLRKRERSTTPVWHERSMRKHEAWQHRSDPRDNRNQVFTQEPNWSRTVQQRRNAWEQKAYDTEARVNLPASAKVPPSQPPAWHNKAARTHNVWQHAADTMSGISQPSQKSYESSFQQSSGDSHQYRSEYHEERRSESQQSQQQQYQKHHEEHYTTSSAPAVQSYTSSQHTETRTTGGAPVQQTFTSSTDQNASNAGLLMNTGFNANQMDYVRDHFDKYRAGPKPPGAHYEETSQSNYSKTYSSTTTTQQQGVAQPEPIPLGPPAGQTYSYSTETRTTTQSGAPVTSSFQQSSYNQTSYSTDQTKPAAPAVGSIEESSYRKSVSESTRSGTTAIPMPAPQATTVEESRYHKTHTTTEETRSIPVSAPQSSIEEKSSYQKSYSLDTTQSAPEPITETKTQEDKFKEMFSSEQARNIPIRTTYASSEGSQVQKSTTTTTKEEHVIPIKPAQTEIKESYQRSESSKQESTRAIPVQPVTSSIQENYQRRTTSTTQETTHAVPVPVPVQPMSSLQESHTKSFTSQSTNQPLSVVPPPQGYTTSSTYHSETHTTQPPVVMHSPGGSYRSYQSSHYSKQEKTTSTTTSQPQTYIQTQTIPITKTTTYDYQQQTVPSQPVAPQLTQSSFTSHTEKTSSTSGAPIPIQQAPVPVPRSNYEAQQYSSHREETRREETSRPVSQLSQYSEQRSFKRNVEEKTETKTIPATTSVLTSDASKSLTAQDIFNKREEMNETLPMGSISNTRANTQGEYRDQQGRDVIYKRETQTAVDPGKEYALLKEEEKRIEEKDIEPGVISRHVTTKYYKKKTVTDTTTTTTPQ